MLAFVVLPLLFAFNLRAEDPAAGLDSAPFGFRCGMTGPQVIRLVGRTAVKKSPEGFLELATAAKPDSVFVSYSLVVSPKHGVVMINALGFNANASPDADLHHAFIDLRERLYGIYGAPDQNLDLIGNSSFAVFGGENAAADPGPRHWVAVWNLMPPPRQHIQGIVLDAEQASGFFFLSYQCAGIEGVSEKVKVSALSQSSVPTAFVPTSSPPAMAAPAAPPTTTAPRALAQMPPGGAPPMAGPPILAPNSPTLTGTTQPGGANNQSARTTTGLSDDRYADIFRGGQAAPATPIAQPPSSLAGPPNLQPPPNFASLPPGAVPPANMPANMPTSTPAMARGLTQGYPPSQPPPAATSPMGQSPALAAAAPSYGSQAPLMSAQPMNGSPPGNPTAPPAAGPAPQLPTINPPLGMDGYCPVSLSESQRWLVGDRRWGAIHRGRTYLFVGPEEQRRFFADPDRYAPAASGNDVVLATEQGQAVPGMRQHGVYFSNRVYLFANEATLEKFSKNPNVYVNQALGSLRAGTYSGQQMR